MPINKAVIAAAGFGTRFLPITKTIQKEMLPILNRPTIDYIVEDCIQAGITDIIFVVNEFNDQIRLYYSQDTALEDRLRAKGKDAELATIQNLHQKANFHFITQKHDGAYGTSIPLLLSEEYIQNEDAFLYLTGDDFILTPDGSSNIKQLIDTFTSRNDEPAGLMACIDRPDDELHRYGVIQHDPATNHLRGIVEKPAPGTAPSNLINISKYILTPSVLPLLSQQYEQPKNSEYFITDILVEQAKTSPVIAHKPNGTFIDSGTVDSWLHANQLLHQHPKY